MNREERKAWLEQFEWQDTDEVLCLAEEKMFVFTAKFLATEGNRLDWSKPKKLLRLVDGEITEVPKKPGGFVFKLGCQCSCCREADHCSNCPCVACKKTTSTYQEHPLWRYFNAELVMGKGNGQTGAARDWVRDQILKGNIK